MSDPGTPRILRIRVDSVAHGFFAQVTYVINQLLHCEREGLTPVVVLDGTLRDGPNPYYDPERGENVWEYFFEPVSEIDSREVLAGRVPGVTRLEDPEIIALSAAHPESVYLYPYHRFRDKVRYDEAWYRTQRLRAHRVIRQYVRIKPAILEAADAFYEEHMAGRHVIGVHLRGTDKRQVGNHRLLAKVIPPRHYRPLIDAHLRNHPDARIFVATDQRQFLGEMERAYPHRVLRTDSLRGSGRGRGSNVFQQAGAGYQKGKDVLVDALLLSRCEILFKCASAVGAFATFFEPELEAIDLNHQRATPARIFLYDLVGASTRPIRRRLGWIE